jgi:peptidoglycan/LPS O-acetylase OafA/YrhL
MGYEVQNYRREIDGLRAIAVIAVMLYHAGLPFFSGGFIGVDVFFVISGFLITGILVRQYENRELRLLDFWVKRAKRILPALVTVLLFCVVASLLLLTPPALTQFGESLSSSAAFSANLFFWRSTSSYFDPNVRDLLLIHLWSLAVEEQFYIFYPWIIVFILKFFRKHISMALLAMLVASLGLSAYMTEIAPRANFYLLPPRAWELLTGALAVTARSRFKSAIVSADRAPAILTAVGLLLILAPMFAYDDTTPFPGLTAVPPVLGTALILLFARADAGFGRVLASRPLVAMGLISYSAYLWHQPFLALGSIYSFGTIGWPANVALLTAACLCAWGSYLFVESPIRHNKSASNRQVLTLAAAAQISAAAVGVILWKSGGLPNRLPPAMVAVALSGERGEARMNALFSNSVSQVDRPPILGRRGPIDIAILGDSHGAAMATGLTPTLDKSGHRAAVFVAGGAMPGMDLDQAAARQLDGVRYLQAATQKIIEDSTYKTVIISARWILYLNGTSEYRDDGGLKFNLADVNQERHRVRALGASLAEFIHRLLAANKRVILIYPVPELPFNLPQYISGSYLRGTTRVADTIPSFSHFSKYSASTVKVLDQLGTDDRLIRFYPSRTICNIRSGACAMVEGNNLLYTDDNHLSGSGAAKAFAPLLPLLQRR